MNSKSFYDAHTNFSFRTPREYELSPGIRCKFDLILEFLKNNQFYKNGLDLGCSGNSILCFIHNVKNKLFLDISDIPLVQYSPKSQNSTKTDDSVKSIHPTCGDICKLPYKSNTFDLICSLDTLEHIKNDKLAVAEIGRVLNQNGICIITVPHKKALYSLQDKIIGHHRRYEIEGLINLFSKNNLKCVRVFNVYGKIMKIAFFQTLNPKRTEKSLINLRLRYENSRFFNLLWKIIVKFSSRLMKIDAKYRKLQKGMNIGFIFVKR
ncbi:MAG: class I SAM-dependent methyltransferase [Promethearchaeota archaeon]|nr:MAG: class I SAM-dependent methyltransferase [Candidatus Lokiarchaeota archaeon]